jgi:hypothetical protein
MQTLKEKGAEEDQQVLMPILDVRTRWSSMHQMLSMFYVFYFLLNEPADELAITPSDRALMFKEDISNFSVRYKDLHAFELSDDEWGAISIVTNWLHAFREATTQMSSTSKPMLSTAHAVFRGLQEELRKAIATLPENVNPQIKLGLLNAQQKLSDYYYTFDQSPFYTWAASKWLIVSLNFETN